MYQLPSGVAPEQVDDQWIVVKLKPNTSLELGPDRTVISLHETDPNHSSSIDGMCKIKLKNGENPVKIINQLLRKPNVIYAEPILNYQPLFSPSDPDNVSNQGYLDVVKAQQAWDITTGDDDITIGIVDTGIDLDHEDLINSIWTNNNDPIDGVDNDNNGYIDDFYGYDFADIDSDPNADGSPHGSRVAGVAGASTDNGVGMSGIGFNTKVAALKGFRTVGTTSNNLFEAILYAADNGIDIVNLSFGSLREGLQSEQDIIDYAVLEKDVVVVAAAGNTNVDGKFHPASYNHILSVGATDLSDNKWTNSTYNYSVDIMAPGTSIYATEVDDDYGFDNGTSYSSPMVAGTAALVKDMFPNLNAKQIMERVRVTADDIYDVGSNSLYEGKMGIGRLNVLNAVSQPNVKALRVNNFTSNTSLSDAVFFGDTVHISAELTNYLAKVDNPQITISSPDNNFSIIGANFYPGTLSTLEETTVSMDIILDESLAVESPIAIRLDYSDGSYNDFQFLETTTSPDYFNFGGDFKMTIAGNGNIAYADASYFNGIGIQYQNNEVLRHGGFMLATSSSEVSSNFISNYLSEGRHQDFVNSKPFKLYHHPSADQFGYSEFLDNEKDIVVEQSIYGWDNEDFLLLRYRVINNSGSAINNLSIGFFSDFDVINPLENRAEYDLAGDYLFVKDNTNTVFAGSKIISSGSIGYSALDVSDQNGNTDDINGNFTESEKFDFLTSQQIVTAGDLGNGNDVAGISGVTITQLDANESEYFNVILAISDSQIGLEGIFTDAENHLNEVIDHPRVLESIFSCEGSQVTLDPSAGTNYDFYEDAVGSTLITSGTSYLTGVINQDTSFFVRNLDGDYPSEIFQYKVNLIDDVADFEMSTDTLYLDNETNVVSFTDQSFQATLWNWDFGEGTQTNIQHPALSYTSTGSFDVSLYIENDAGCSDTQIKTLVVANRPSSPSFPVYEICPGETITLNDPTADYLKAYENGSDSEEITKGDNLILGPFEKDSTIYISGTYSMFESLKVPVSIDVDEVNSQFDFLIDTLSENHQIIARYSGVAAQINWLVNGVSAGSTSEITIPASSETVNVLLTVENNEGCIVSNQKEFSFNSSPIPSQLDVSFCQGETPMIRPQNGDVFGFYQDESLTTLLHKGKVFDASNHSKIFVVGLEDGLPSSPREVNISIESFGLQIITAIEKVSERNKVVFSTNEGTQDHEWFIDGVLVETSELPTLFLDDGQYEVVLNAANSNGCRQTDTLLLDLLPPLSVKEDILSAIYPNPSSGKFAISDGYIFDSISIWDLAGKIQFSRIVNPSNILDLTHLNVGTYLFKGESQGVLISQKLIIE